MQNILKMMDIATGADIKALQKEIRLLKNAGRSASTAKQARSTTARRTTAGGTRKKTARPVAKKRTTAGAKKRALLRVPGSVRQPQGAKSLPPKQQENDFRRGRPTVSYNFMDVPKLYSITSAIIFFRNLAPTAVLRFNFDFNSASDRDLSCSSSAKLSIPASEILLINVR